MTTLALGDGHACASEPTGELWCWGGNHYGQLGVGGGPATASPIRVAGSTEFTRVDTGWMHTCGLTAAGALQCWGNNEQGQLASGSRVERAAPPGVSARRMLPRRRGPDGRLVVTSFNVLGSQHTRPGGGTPHFGPGRIRTEWAADALRGMGADLVSFQELQRDQYDQLRDALGDTYTFYPENTSRDPKLVWQSVMWRTSEWQLVEAKDISVPVNGKLRPHPFVKLRNRATGRAIWMMNVHNSSKRTPERQRDRNAAVRIELDHVKQQRRKGTPVLLMGDFNEREVAFCKVTGQTDLAAVNGGSHTGRRCTPPRGMHIDWIFGAPTFRRRGYEYLRSPLTNRITDHTVLTGVYAYMGA
jgi:endonuclease/exonuclease/phosphatase family metal-dependent hydrolase